MTTPITGMTLVPRLSEPCQPNVGVDSSRMHARARSLSALDVSSGRAASATSCHLITFECEARAIHGVFIEAAPDDLQARG